ncbi:MAG: NAD-dependent epimerase/dehydratase family protein [Bacteroidia bacterium]|nr:NAD-dependent epimerase/dehydratase family protein [Bacteroidia bacterium]
MFLITGSTGLLGSHVLYALLQKHDRVAALKRPSAKIDTLREIFSYYTHEPDALMERINWQTGDLLDKESLNLALEGISCVINCAAVVSFDPRDRKRMIANNVEGVRNLAEAILSKEVRGLRTGLIHISSISALGDGPGDEPKFLIDEDTPRDPKRRHSGYSVSKFDSEKLLREMGVNAIILNPGVILGPGQWTKGSSQLCVKAWQGLKYYPYGGTGFVDVRDLADIITQIGDQVSGIGYRGSGIGDQVSGIGDQVSGIGDQVSGIGDQPAPASDLNLSPSSDFRLPSSVPGERFCIVGANLRYRDFFNLVTDEFGKPNPHIYAGKFMTGLAWRADTLRSGIKGRNPLLTRETAIAAQRISFYSSKKICNALNFEFRPIEETIAWVAGCWEKNLRL